MWHFSFLHFQSYQTKMSVLTTRATVWTRISKMILKVVTRRQAQASERYRKNTDIKCGTPSSSGSKNSWERSREGSVGAGGSRLQYGGTLTSELWTLKLKVNSVLALKVHQTGSVMVQRSGDVIKLKDLTNRGRCLNSPEEAPTEVTWPKVQVGSTATTPHGRYGGLLGPLLKS